MRTTFQSLIQSTFIPLILALAASNGSAGVSGAPSPAIITVVETGGDNETGDTVQAKWTGVTWTDHALNEPINPLALGAPYTVGVFGNHAPAFVDRTHRYTNADVVPIPSYLLGKEYIMSGNDNRDNATYRLDVSVNVAVQVYLLIDNRLGDPNSSNADPPSFGPTKMQWVLDEGWTAMRTGANRAGDVNLPDEVGIDEGADGTINQYYSIYTKAYPAGTFQLKQADNAGQNMFGVVVVPATLNNFIQLGRVRTGSYEYVGRTAGGEAYTIVGGGNDTWDRQDELAFAYHEYAGDFDIKVQVSFCEASGTWSKAGIMVRESLAEDSRRVLMCTEGVGTTSAGAAAANVHEFLWRTGAFSTGAGGENGGQNSTGGGPTTFPNDWIRLVRQGSVLTGFRGTDGANWTQQGTIDTSTFPDGPLPGKLFGGLSVSRHPSATKQTCLAVFTNYTESASPFCYAANSRGCPGKIFVCFSRPVGAGALVPGNYSANNVFVLSAEPGPTPNVVCLNTDPLTEGTEYTLSVVNVKDSNGNDLDANCAGGSFVHAKGYELRRIHVQHNKNPHDPANDTLDVYLGSKAYALGMGAASVERPGNEGNTVFEDPAVDTGDHERFTGRVVGILQPSADINAIFAMSSDDEGRLFLSSDDQPANKVLIAREPAWNGRREYAAGGNQGTRGVPPANISTPKALGMGKKYYLEVVYAEGGGGNNGSATWDAGTGAPFANGQSPIEEANFAESRFAWGHIFYTLGDVQLLTPPASQTVPVGATVTFGVVLDGTPPYDFQWKRDGVPIPGANSATYTIPSAAESDNGARFSVSIANACSATNSPEARLNVLLNPRLTGCTSRGNCHAVYVQYNKPMMLDGVYTVTCSNTVSGLVSPLVVTGIRAGRTPNEVCLAVTPDLLPETNVYCVTVLGAHGVDGLIIDPNPDSCCFVHGAEFPAFRVLYKRFDDVGNGNLSAFQNSAKYVNDMPDVIEADPPGNNDPNFHGFESRTNQRENFGGTLLGFYIAPQTGAYRFWMSSDDPGVTYIAEDAIPAHKRAICVEPAWGAVRGWTDAGHDNNDNRGSPPIYDPPANTTGNGSLPIHLTAGQKVYLQTDYTEGGGGDNAAVTVTIDDEAIPANGVLPIDGANFMRMRVSPQGVMFTALCDVFCNPGPSDQTAVVGQSATFVGSPDGTPPYTLQWKRNGVPIPGANGSSYTTPPVTEADEGTVYTFCVSNEFSTNQCRATLRVRDCIEVTMCGTWGDPNHIYVFYNQPVNTNGTYTLDGGLFVSTVAYGTNKNIIVVLTDTIPADTGPYTLTITGVTGTNNEALCGESLKCVFSQGPGRLCTDFNAGLPDGSIASGTAPPAVGPDAAGVVPGVFLHLTDKVNSQANYWTVPLPGVQTFDCFKAKWRTLLDTPGGADGISFTVGNNVGTGFTPEEGGGSGLAVCIDTFNNGAGDAGLDIKWNGVTLTHLPVGPGTDGAGSPPALALARFVDTSVDVDTAGRVTFTYDTLTITGQIPSFMGINANQYVFAARTGGANENAWIDDLCINDFTLGPIAVTISGCPTSSVPECSSITLTATATGSPCYLYQWCRNGVPIPGATGASYTTPPLDCPTDQGATYQVKVQNHFSRATSAECVVRVDCDTLAPTLVSAVRGCLNKSKVTVLFAENRFLDAASANTPVNYSIDGGTPAVTGAMLLADGKTVMLTTAAPLADGQCYKLVVNNVKDCAGNSVPANSMALIQLVGSRSMLPSGAGQYEVVVEAEDFDDNNSPQGASRWIFDTTLPGYSGTGYMCACPDAGVFAGNPDVTLNPRLFMDYCVNFPEGPTYPLTAYVWVRGSSPDGGGNSIHLGLDGGNPVLSSGTDRIGNGINNWGGACGDPNAFGWINGAQGPPARVDVPSAGLHVFRIYLREDGAKIDQFLLTTDAALVIDNCAPARSAGVRDNANALKVSLDCQSSLGDVVVEWDDDNCRLQCTRELHSNPASNVWTDITNASPYRIPGFTVDLNCLQEIAPAVDCGGRTGTGTGSISVCGDKLTVNVAFSGLSGNTIAAHIHAPAPPGMNASVLYPLGSVTLGATAGTINEMITLVDKPGYTVAQQRADLAAGNMYVNIHTTAFNGGEIRGQILLRKGNRFYRVIVK